MRRIGDRELVVRVQIDSIDSEIEKRLAKKKRKRAKRIED